MSTAIPDVGEQRVIIENVRWSTYLALLEDSGNCHGRMTYDEGTLEIMSPSKAHENVGRLIGRMVETFTEESGIDILSVASMTTKREVLQRGFEADEAYYIQHADQVRRKENLDFAIDPAPDLVIEVDMSRSSMGKLPIFAAFFVPEIWQYKRESFQVFCLDGTEYRAQTESQVLPRFPFDQLRQMLSQRNSLGETEQIRTFRTWLRDYLRT